VRGVRGEPVVPFVESVGTSAQRSETLVGLGILETRIVSNQLAREPSAYLQSAAGQPVHWQAWSDAAFARAKAENKPILLDIGAVWCHWCHVMDHESYDDPDVAALLNRDFVCLKVDRDERPDVDARYQRAVAALTGQGGWPLTAFLTPDGDVFFGGTYFPPEQNALGRPGFLTVLRHVARVFREERDKIRDSAQAIRAHVAETLNEAKPGSPSTDLIAGAADQMARLFDVRYGGFGGGGGGGGGAPKFPHPGACEFLLARWRDTGLDWQREIVEKTLAGMARGGVRDHLGGGFHRYAVDERWIVPHFEKMSYDNSELLRAYCAAAAAFDSPRFRDVAAGVVDWVLEVLADRAPGRTAFYTSQDADVGTGDDGDYWTWTPEEVDAVLTPAERELMRDVFDVADAGEMHHNPRKNVLWQRRELRDAERETFRSACRKLKRARDARPAPAVDRAAYVSWNAMMAGAFLQAGAALDRPECNDLALQVLERIWAEAWHPGDGMSHVIGRVEPRGLLEDNVHAAAAFLDAFEATGEAAWLARATAVMRHCLAAHWDDVAGGFWDLAGERAGAAYLATRAKAVQDAPTPSGNGVAAVVLARLWAHGDDAEWRTLLDRQLTTFAGGAADLALYGATLFRAMDWALHPITRIDVAGPRGDGPACAMHLLALQAYRPRKIVVRREAATPSATVCVGTTCSLPVTTPDALARLLA
jgi:uncharacterized protein YyaL (SSP411 family)